MVQNENPILTDSYNTDRVALGVQHDLFPVAELLSAVEKCTAQKMRVLFKAGFTAPEHFAAATPEQLVAALAAAESYKATQLQPEPKKAGGDFRLCRLLVRHAKQLAGSYSVTRISPAFAAIY